MQLLVYLYNFINDNVQLYEVVFSFFIGALKDKHNLHSKANNCTQTLCIIYVRFTFCITLYLVNRSIIFLSEASNKCSHIVLHIVSSRVRGSGATRPTLAQFFRSLSAAPRLAVVFCLVLLCHLRNFRQADRDVTKNLQKP